MDTLRNGDAKPAPPAPTRTREDSDASRARSLARAGIEGVLFYVEASTCRLRALRLPQARAARAPEWENCTASVSPDGRRTTEGGSVWRADSELVAVEIAGGVDVVAITSRWAHRFEGARAPAFKPDGALTYLRGGRLVEWTTACRGATATLTFREPRPTQRCRRLVRTEAEVSAAAPEVPRPAGTRLALEEVAWLDNERFAALVRTGIQDALVVVGPRRVSGPWMLSAELSRLEASPRRGYVSVAWGGDVLVFTRGGVPVETPEDVRAYAWSPDDAWLAVAHRESIAFYSPRRRSDQVAYVPVAARDLAWR